LQFIVGLLIGGFITWLVTHLYYRRSRRDAQRDQEIIYNKLSKEIRDAILQDDREKFTVPELCDLINSPSPSSPSNMVCPECGSANLRQHHSYVCATDDYFPYLECDNCGWSDLKKGN